MREDSEPGPDGQEQAVWRLTTWEYGPLGRQVRQTRPDGGVITRTYDQRGNLTAYTDPQGHTTTYQYDCLGRLIRVTYPDSSTKSYTYLPDGELGSLTRADGTELTFSYDAAGRLTEVKKGQEVLASYAYDLAGHLLQAANAQARLAFSWDSTGNQLSESLELLHPAFAGLGVKQLRRSFDVANRVEEVELPDGLGRLQRGYDAGDRLVSLGVDGTTLWQASYDGARLGRIERGNGVVTAFAYTPEGLPAHVLTGLGEGSGEVAHPLHRLAFSWTLGQLQRSRLREDMAKELWAFHYDSLGHLEGKAGDPAWPAVKRLEPAWQLPGLPVPASLVESWQVGQGDELLRRDRRQAGRHEPLSFSHNLLHQVTQGTGSVPVSYTWDVNGNLATRTGGFYGDASFTHDALDRLVRVSQGGATTDLVLDPLGRLVGKVRHSPEGEMARAYLHDGEQVVVEYGKQVGGAGWKAQRRHLWGRWIDELAVEQVDMDGDGSLETSLWPVSDLLGSIELVTDGSGSIVERITYDPAGRPQVWSADTQRPRVTRVAWTGDGSDGRCPAGIPALPCPPWAFQLGFGEELDPESAAGATASLTPQGGQPVPLTVTLTPDTRAAYLTGATLQAGSSYTLHLEGLRDRAGNLLWQWGAHTGAPLLTFTLTDPTVFQVLEDTAPPRLLAALDAQDGLYLAWEEPVEVASGFNLDTSMAVLRQGQLVQGTVSQLSPQLFRWRPAEASQWLVGGEYTLSAVHLQDLSGKAATAPSLSFTHMAASSQVAYLVYQAPGDSQPQPRSAYGLTTLFQGRTWHEELGLYHYRARWYSPELGDFLERDPLGYVDSPNLYQFLNRNPVNFLDPFGESLIISIFAGRSRLDNDMLERIRQGVDSLFRNPKNKIDWEKAGGLRVKLAYDVRRTAASPPLPHFGEYTQVKQLLARKEALAKVRKVAESWQFNFLAVVELEGELSYEEWQRAKREHLVKPDEQINIIEGVTVPQKEPPGTYSVVFEREVTKALQMFQSKYKSWPRKDRELEAMYL
jgi:RHS repeat-associated protein